MDELRPAVRIEYEVAANWKIVVENYNECLHCPTIHPELVQVVPLYRFGEVHDGETGDDGNWMVEGATSFTRTGRSDLPPFPDLRPDDYRMYYGTFQFPNLMLNLHPDAAMYYLALPRGPGHTTVISEYLFRPETIAAPDFQPEPVVELWDLISRQDWAVCERAQTGRRLAGVQERRLPAQGPLPVRLQRALPRGDGSPEAGLISRLGRGPVEATAPCPCRRRLVRRARARSISTGGRMSTISGWSRRSPAWTQTVRSNHGAMRRRLILKKLS